jgi:hypothetical protein
MKINKTTQESITVYGDGLRELLRSTKIPPKGWDSIWENDDEELEDDPELQWFIGWFSGVAEATGVACEKLITLHEAPAKKKAPVKKKKAAVKKKAPVKKNKKAPVKRKKAAA